MMMEKQFYVYILASKRNGTLYLGVTSDIVKLVLDPIGEEYGSTRTVLLKVLQKSMELKGSSITKSMKMPKMLSKGKNVTSQQVRISALVCPISGFPLSRE